MLVERTMHASWLSNSWLLADRPGGHAVVIDTGGPFEPLRQKIEEHRLTLTRVLCTHHHYDHVHHNDDYRAAFGCPVCGHAREAALFPGAGLDEEIAGGDEIAVGDLRVRALHIPGHTIGQLGFLVDDRAVFTGDTLFRGSVGGTRAPGHTTFEDLHASIMDVLMQLPKETVVYPGHMDETTIGAEWESNPFVRAWRGKDTAAPRRCTAYGEPAELLVEAMDYDGGTKCQVRFDTGAVDVVPGSRVEVSGS